MQASCCRDRLILGRYDDRHLAWDAECSEQTMCVGGGQPTTASGENSVDKSSCGISLDVVEYWNDAAWPTTPLAMRHYACQCRSRCLWKHVARNRCELSRCSLRAHEDRQHGFRAAGGHRSHNRRCRIRW